MAGLSKSERFKALLAKGFFPEELPPPFVTDTFARYRTSIFNNWSSSGQQPSKTIPEIYSYPRVGRRRRRLAIVNPISQLYLSKEIAENWIKIQQHIGKSKVSLDIPQIVSDANRAVPKPDFNLIALNRLDAEARYRHILVSDISRFYGTIYTHTLPWALHGKAYCKANVNNPAVMNSLLGDTLDRLVRKGQDNQTIGIPIGPDTSRILAEIIAVAVEDQFLSISGFKDDKVFRYVDDWFVGFDGAGEAEDAVSFLAKACGEYELEINDAKTVVVDPIDPSEEIWPIELREHPIRTQKLLQARDLKHYFTKAFHFASEHRDQNVLDYALKRVRSISIAKENVPLLESYVVRAARANSVAFPIAAQILINLKFQGFPLSQSRTEKLVYDTILESAIVGRHGELSWALFLAKGLGIKIPDAVMKDVLEVESSVCALITLDLIDLGLVSSAVDTSFWQSFMNADALKSNMWLLAYEADIKGWLPSPHNHVSSHVFFKELKSKGVFFYDRKKNVPTFKKAIERQREETRRRQSSTNMLRLLWRTQLPSLPFQ